MKFKTVGGRGPRPGVDLNDSASLLDLMETSWPDSAVNPLTARHSRDTRKARANVSGGRTLKRNLTISLETDLVKKARVIAARRDTSLSRMLADEIRRLVAEDEGYERARRKALAHLRAGFALGGKIATSRERWHER